MRLVGLDPGLRHTGFGVIDADDGHLRFVACGRVDTEQTADLATRLRQLDDRLAKILLEFAPREAAVEETVINVNASSSLKLGQARGVVVLAAARQGLRVFEYASTRVKRGVTGTGSAGKDQVAAMVRVLLPTARASSSDALDALAVAICHAHYRLTEERIARRTPVAT